MLLFGVAKVVLGLSFVLGMLFRSNLLRHYSDYHHY
jgi:hypothetical protein